MIETEQTIAIDAPIATVWTYARAIDGWAKLMPGLQGCEIVDENDSHWTLKVGVGGLVRTVKVFVHVDRWAGPGEVDFTYKLKGDPVNGGGVYRARTLGPDQTEITLGVRVVGEGPMAPMWEAMGRPLLPKFARGFAEEFKAEVERNHIPSAPPIAPPIAPAMPSGRPSLVARLVAWIGRLFRANSA